jgi:hypothetical protein
VVSDVANLAADVVNVAVGTFFGGGFVPGVGVPFVAPPPLLSYDNVPVQVRYSDATYEPFLVRQIVDVGDDIQYGGRKVLLDGATPAWGQWVSSPTGERQFEVHRTQQYPGLGEPQEAPLPGDYQMRLASWPGWALELSAWPSTSGVAGPSRNGASWSAGQLSGTPADLGSSATSRYWRTPMTCLVRLGSHPINWTAVQLRP